ncbi:glypican-5a isoform X2 [Brienomyrus brachyistius]|uniref:glypican-5a isoform X2 n=1 Tax=Brienomyrus brachyistius TaxID=42636 RepID=UPI0020B2E598|nr:glypican-5a isoform X2 [Brienomyrus brachyistius]
MEKQELLCCLVLVFPAVCLQSPTDCSEVQKLFHLNEIGPIKTVPETPRKGSDLQVCDSLGVTCCTKNMEERYQTAAQKNVQNLIQMTSSSLRTLTSRNVAEFQEIFKSLTWKAENDTNSLFNSIYQSLAPEAEDLLRELFTDIGLFVLGSELGMEVSVYRFFDGLFPLVYNHLINPGVTGISSVYAECIRSTRRQLNPFGRFPKELADEIGHSLLPTRVFLQALNLAIEVINTTDHLQCSAECTQALLKMLYCPHCQGLTQSKPCMGYCLNVMRGCLASVEEIDGQWREFVRSVDEASSRLHGAHEPEQKLLAVHLPIINAVMHAQQNGPKLSAQVHKVCGDPDRTAGESVSVQQEGDSARAPRRAAQMTFSSKRKEFVTSLRHYHTFYAVLADKLCVSELASGDGMSCWNGEDVVKSYTLRVVDSGIRAQAVNPEVRVKGPDPVMHQIIDKLKHVNQLLQGKAVLASGMLDVIEKGSGEPDLLFSGDCDDEDGCAASGHAQTPDKVNDHRRSSTQMKTVRADLESASGHETRAGLLTLSLIFIIAHLCG